MIDCVDQIFLNRSDSLVWNLFQFGGSINFQMFFTILKIIINVFKYLDDVSEEDILGMNVPTGMPLVYELDENLKPVSRQYLSDPEKVAKAMEAVANQGKAKWVCLR